MKLACIIQGDIRTNKFDLILDEIQKHFSLVIVSCWESDPDLVPRDNLIQLKNTTPTKRGFQNRNLQRFSTARGIELAKKLGVDYALKWRSDFLPTKFDLNIFIDKCENGNKIVFPAFRNLSVCPDFFSSFPDYFAFGSIKMLELLWGDQDHDYSKDYNLPKKIKDDVKIINNKVFYQEKDYSYAYDPHVELYALFKDKIFETTSVIYSHPDIIFEFFNPINHKDLKICWFSSNSSYRSITQAIMFPWWTTHSYNTGSVKYASPGYEIHPFKHFIGKLISRFIVQYNIYQQFLWYHFYLKNKK